jgi:sec-independent protein translocase protein TatA
LDWNDQTSTNKKRAACGRPFFNEKAGAIMFGLGHWELLLILVIVLIVFGAGKLPEMGAGIGKGIKSFKKGVADVETEKETNPQEIEA